MTAALWFALGVFAGASVVLALACCRIGARTLPVGCPEPVVAPVQVVTGCRCIDCATAADVHAIRMLPEATR